MIGVTLHSNVEAAHQGGGLIYAAALARALAEILAASPRRDSPPVAFETRAPLAPAPSSGDLEDLLPFSLGRVELRVAPPPARSAGRELVRAWRARSVTRAAVVQSTEIPRLRRLGRSALLCDFPFQKHLTPLERLRLALYRPVVVNSRFTARCLERRWGRRARVLPPPVFPVPPDAADGSGARAPGSPGPAKEPLIVAVGRFTTGGRPKRQRQMVHQFARLLREAPEQTRGWSLHLAGTVADPAYLAAVREAARGLPVELHPDLPRAELEALLRRSSLFWHAVGEGLDPEVEPDRLEHFGIATAEAMSAGAVPVVYGQGGQPEVVVGAGAPAPGRWDGDEPETEPAGVLWQTWEECRAATLELMADGERRRRLGELARHHAASFGPEAFARRAGEIFAPLLGLPAAAAQAAPPAAFASSSLSAEPPAEPPTTEPSR